MMYVVDMLFIFCYLACEKATTWVQNRRLRWYFKVREILQWLQFFSILGYLYGRPYHNDTERQVSFTVMIATKLIFDLIAMNQCKKDRQKMLQKNKIV